MSQLLANHGWDTGAPAHLFAGQEVVIQSLQRHELIENSQGGLLLTSLGRASLMSVGLFETGELYAGSAARNTKHAPAWNCCYTLRFLQAGKAERVPVHM